MMHEQGIVIVSGTGEGQFDWRTRLESLLPRAQRAWGTIEDRVARVRLTFLITPDAGLLLYHARTFRN